MGERAVYSALSSRSRFIAPLYATIKTSTSVAKLLGVTLVSPLEMLLEGSALKENEAKHIAACIVGGLAQLQVDSVICRGIHPEWLMLDSDGYLVLTDFRLSKVVGRERANTLC